MARRINTRFLTILTVAVVGGMIALLAMAYLARRQNPDALIAEAERAEKAGDYENAVANLRGALAARSGDAQLAIRLGDLAWRGGRVNGEYLRLALQSWQQALESDPTNKVALERLFDAHHEWIEVQPQPGIFESLGRWAGKLYAIDKKNAVAEAWQHLWVLGAWVNESASADRRLPITQRRVEETVGRLLEFMKQHPEMVEPPFYVARAYIKMGQDRAVRDRAGALEMLDKARKLMEQSAAASPNSALMRYRQLQVLAGLPPGPPDTDAYRQWRESMKQAIDEAQRLVKPADQDYIEIQLAAVRFRLASSDRKAAMDLLTKLREERPEDVQVRIAMAIALRDVGERAQAIELLNKPTPEDKTLVGFRTGRRTAFEWQRLEELARTQIEAFIATDDAAARKSILTMINQACDEMAAAGMTADHPDLLELRGIALLLQEKNQSTVSAVQMLQKACDAGSARGDASPRRALWLVRAYKQAGQWGMAMSVVSQAIERAPSLELRLERMELLLREHRMDDFKQELAQVEKLAPNHPKVQRLRLATLDPATDKDQIARTISELPEQNDLDKFRKAGIAWTFGDSATAERLLQDVRSVDSLVVPATRLMVRICLKKGQRDKAREVLAESLAKKADPALKLLQAAVEENQTPEQIEKITRDALDTFSDPVERALRQHMFARRRNAMDEAKSYLDEAVRLAEEDGRVQDALFRWHTDNKQWAEAVKAVEKLATLNFDQAEGLHYRFELCMRQGKPADALTYAGQLVKQQHEFAMSWLSMARAQLALGMYDSAKDNFAQALQRQSNSVEALRGLVECCERLRQFDEMRKYLQTAMRLFPNDWSFADMTLRFEEEYGDPARAIPLREEMAKKRPDELYHQTSLARAYWRLARVRKADEAFSKLQLDKSWQLLQSIKSKPQWMDAAAVYALIAEVAADLGRVDDGVAAFGQLAAREKWKDKPEPYLMLGEYCQRYNRPTDAEAAYKQAVARSTDQPVRLAMARFYLVSPEVKDHLLKAIEVLRQVYASSKQLEIRRLLLDTQVRANQLEEAAKGLDAALAENKGDSELLTIRAMLALRLEPPKQAQAMADLDQALGADPRNGSALRLRAQLRLAGGKIKEALDDLRRAARLLPGDADVRMALARAMLGVGREAEAIQEAEEALRLRPQSREIRLVLVQMCRSRSRSRALELVSEAQKLAGLSTDPIWLYIEADLLQANNPELALKKIQDARRLAPNDAEISMREAELLLSLRNPAAAMDSLDRAARQGGEKSYRLPMLRGMVRAAQNQKEQALNEFGTAMGLTSDNGTAQVVLDRVVASLGLSQAIAAAEKRIAEGEARWKVLIVPLYMAEKQPEKASKMADSVVRAESFKSLTPAQQMVAMVTASRAYIGSGAQDNFKAAIWAHEEALKLYAQDPMLLDDLGHISLVNNLACILGEMVRPTDPQLALKHATTAYNLVQRLDSTRVTPARRALVLDTYGWMLVRNNDPDRAIGPLIEAAQNDPSLLEVSYHLGEAYLMQKKIDLAKQSLTQAALLLKQREDEGKPVQGELKTSIAGAQARLAEQLSKNRPGG